MIQAQYFHYEILEEYPLSEIENHKEHRRLRVFYEKGCTCVECGIEATKLALGRQKNGSLHIDVYTDDFYPLTVDHIVPKSKGGSDDISNLQPMCCLCNWGKGNGDKPARIGSKKYKYLNVSSDEVLPEPIFTREGFNIGDTIWVKKKNRFKEGGVIKEFCINPHNGKNSVKLENRRDSMYSLKALYKQVII